jgi:hypothetical protein
VPALVRVQLTDSQKCLTGQVYVTFDFKVYIFYNVKLESIPCPDHLHRLRKALEPYASLTGYTGGKAPSYAHTIDVAGLLREDHRRQCSWLRVPVYGGFMHAQ